MSALHDDPRLTAYALGELEGEEQAEIKALLADDPAARAAVEEIRAVAALLTDELGAETAPDEALRESLVEPPPMRRRWWLVGSGAAALAASIALAFVVHSQRSADAPGDAVDGALMKVIDEKPAQLRAKAKSAAPPTIAMAPAIMPVVAPASAPATAAIVAYRWSAGYADADEQPVDTNQSADNGLIVGGKMANRPIGANQGDRSTAGLIAINPEPHHGDRFAEPGENPFKQPATDPLSTFSIDVDTASYSLVRSMLTRGRVPPTAAVRLEELINYFEYADAPPKDQRPFATHVEVAAAPWAPSHRLVRIGLKGKMVDRPRANLVFLIDVSGSMQARNKLPLLKDAMSTLVDTLHPSDRVAIVVYAGAAGLVLPSTPAREKATILNALDRLRSGGSTNGGAGIERAYREAQANFIRGGVNRVIIGTDGDFNVGTTSRAALVEMVQQRAKAGVALTVLGFGMGNYNDATLEQLADKGDGNYAYIDTPQEARKVMVDQLEGTLVTIAKDVKIQVEFNPTKVASYRLIGYENRVMAARDFNDDTKDAGEIGAGHSVTALYEVVPTGTPDGRPAVDPLKYRPRPPPVTTSDELLTVKLRYKAPTGGRSTLIETPLVDDGAPFAKASTDLRFAASVAAFGMLVRRSPHAGDASFAKVLVWAEDAMGDDAWGYRKGFLNLVRRAQQIWR